MVKFTPGVRFNPRFLSVGLGLGPLGPFLSPPSRPCTLLLPPLPLGGLGKWPVEPSRAESLCATRGPHHPTLCGHGAGAAGGSRGSPPGHLPPPLPCHPPAHRPCTFRGWGAGVGSGWHTAPSSWPPTTALPAHPVLFPPTTHLPWCALWTSARTPTLV